MTKHPLARRLLAEFTGTGLLVVVVVGSGIMAVRLSPGNTGLELLENCLATTAGLALVVFALARSGRGALAPVAVAGWIGAAYWATSSTSFANPAVTVGRAFTGTFAGIAPGSVPGFIVAQAAGGVLGVVLVLVLFPAARPDTDDAPARAGAETVAAGAVPPAGN
ncbi:MAG: aquaporin [Trebonia sp.]